MEINSSLQTHNAFYLKLVYFLTSFIFMICIPSYSQDQKKADSLREIVRSYDLTLQHKEKIILNYRSLLENEQNVDSVIYYGNIFYQFGTTHSLDEVVRFCHLKLGTAYVDKGQLGEGLDHLLKSLNYAQDSLEVAVSYSNIASVYYSNEDYINAFHYFHEAKILFSKLGDSLRLGTTLVSYGYAHYKNGAYDSALRYTNEAREIFENLNIKHNKYYWAYATGNLSLIMAKVGQVDEAEEGLISAIKILSDYQDNYAICDYELQLADIYFSQGYYREALRYGTSGMELSKRYKYKEFIRNASQLLSELHYELENYRKAYEYLTHYISYKDSLVNADLIRKLADQQKEFEVAQKQAEVDLLNVEKRNQQLILFAVAGFAVILIVLALIIYKYYQSKARVNKILETQKQELEALNQTKDKFFSIISHDLRGPVSSFHGISRMIKYLVESKETDQLLEVADDIDQSVDRLSSLLDNLLQWAMQQQGHFPNVPEKINLNELTDDLVKTLNTMATGKNINLSAEVDEEINLWVDKNTTMTILRNLVNNALKFTPEEGSVTISASAEGDFAEIRVSDTGVGIPRDKLKKLFKLQDKKSTYGTSGEKGLGLGLQLVYEFIEMNQGSIAVESKEDKGTTFTVRLPLFESVGVEV